MMVSLWQTHRISTANGRWSPEPARASAWHWRGNSPAHGAKLILTARRKERLDSLAAELTAKGTEVRIVVADLNDPAAPQQIYDATEGAGLAVDILINNAGLGQFGEFYRAPSSRN